MRAWVTIVILLAWFCLAMPAHAEKRLALVIGNDSYQHIDALRKARADAKSYADPLREKGFSVEDRYDLGIVDMRAAVVQVLVAPDFQEQVAGPPPLRLDLDARHVAWAGRDEQIAEAALALLLPAPQPALRPIPMRRPIR